MEFLAENWSWLFIAIFALYVVYGVIVLRIYRYIGKKCIEYIEDAHANNAPLPPYVHSHLHMAFQSNWFNREVKNSLTIRKQIGYYVIETLIWDKKTRRDWLKAYFSQDLRITFTHYHVRDVILRKDQSLSLIHI